MVVDRMQETVGLDNNSSYNLLQNVFTSQDPFSLCGQIKSCDEANPMRPNSAKSE